MVPSLFETFGWDFFFQPNLSASFRCVQIWSKQTETERQIKIKLVMYLIMFVYKFSISLKEGKENG